MDSRIKFRIVEHSRKPGVKILEILLDGQMCATIYPDDENSGSIKLVSAHFAGELTHQNQFPEGIRMHTGEGVYPPVPAVHLSFDPRKYWIELDSISREP